MPNTLAHLAVHGPVTRRLIGGAGLRWIYLGCVLPDLPWIVQRLLKPTGAVDDYELRLYIIVQASLFGCLFIAGAAAALAERPGRAFAVLAVGALLHQLLDATQIKWGLGVHLFAPIDWRALRFDLFWPESPPTLVLTLAGLGYAMWRWRNAVAPPLDLDLRPRRLATALALVALWLVVPVVLRHGPERADSHFVATERDRATRTGKPLEKFRAHYYPSHGGVVMTIDTREIQVEGFSSDRPERISLRGVFVAPDRLRIDDVHVHTRGARDAASYLGLAFVAVVWLVPLARAGRDRWLAPSEAPGGNA